MPAWYLVSPLGRYRKEPNNAPRPTAGPGIGTDHCILDRGCLGGGEMRLSKFLTRAESAELNRRLKRAGYRSTAELCYDYVANIINHFGGCDIAARGEVRRIIDRMGEEW